MELQFIDVFAGGRHTCAIKSGIGWTDGKDYTDRLYCFGRNEEGQSDVPIGMANDAWETVYESDARVFKYTDFWHLLMADTRDGQRRVAERRKTQRTWFAGVTKAAPSYRITYPSLLSARALFGSQFRWEMRMHAQCMQPKIKLRSLEATLFAGEMTSEFRKMGCVYQIL
jgi:hypothetical protein